MDILIVDDSDAVREIGAEYLMEAGQTAHAVPDAEAALEYLSHHAVDAVVTDLNLPGMSGKAFIQRIQSLYPKLSVIISSGSEVRHVAIFEQEGVPEVLLLPKPYDLEMLQVVLAQVAHRHNVNPP